MSGHTGQSVKERIIWPSIECSLTGHLTSRRVSDDLVTLDYAFRIMPIDIMLDVFEGHACLSYYVALQILKLYTLGPVGSILT